MGIRGLMDLIKEYAPKAIKESAMKNYFNRKIAIDASIYLYQFLIAIRMDPSYAPSQNINFGETTSHLVGLFYRTISMMEQGIKPIYVFDGDAPVMKSGELAKRAKRKEEAQKALEEAKECGDEEALAKAHKRAVRVSPEHVAEAKKLLKLMGVPVVEAPSEADAQCVAFVKKGLCYAVATEDMDMLTLGVPSFIRRLTTTDVKKKPVLEISLDKVLEGFEINMDEFIDLCILLGCDYCDTIHGIGKKTAFSLIKKYRNMETILENLDSSKYKLPENFNYLEARELFKNPPHVDCSEFDFQWTAPDEEGLKQFLVQEKAFSSERVEKGVEKLKALLGKKVQERITSFFQFQPRPSPSLNNSPVNTIESVKSPNKSRVKRETNDVATSSPKRRKLIIA